MTQLSKYLSKLKYDPALEKKFIAKYLLNIRLVILFVLSILVVGTVSLLSLPRTLNPEVEIPFVAVSTVLPGAGPEDVESLVTVPIEDSLKSLDNVKNLTSTSQDNVSVTVVEFQSSVSVKDAEDKVKSAVDTVNSLPEEAQDPHVASFDFENQPIIIYALTAGQGAQNSSLNSFAQNLKDKLEESSQIKEVVLNGQDEKEVQVLFTPETLISQNINPALLSQNLKSQLTSFPGGSIASEYDYLYPISIEKNISNINDLRLTPININGHLVNLGEIAKVVETTKPNKLNSYYGVTGSDPQNAIIISVFKTKSAKIDVAEKDAQKIIDEELQKYDGAFQVNLIQNLAKDISSQFNDLSLNFTQTLLLVFATLFIFLGIRQSTIVALSIPLSFLITFTVMSLTGLSLNFLSLFSLLLALGLLVDDAIVVTSAMTTYHRSKKFTESQTALLVWKDFIVPIWSTTITTVWAFLPLLLASGIIGEFIKTIPIVVSSTLIASTTVAVLITLPFTRQIFELNIPKRLKIASLLASALGVIGGFALLVPKDPLPLYLLSVLLFLFFIFTFYRTKKELFKKVKIDKKYIKYLKHGIIDPQKVTIRYEKFITKIIKSKTSRRKVVLAVTIFSVFSYLLLPAGFVVNEFFPKVNDDIIYLNLELPAGTVGSQTEKEALELATSIKNTQGVSFYTIEVGQTVDSENGPAGAGENSARFTLNLEKENSTEIAEALRSQFASYSKGKLTVVEVSGGPPVGSDLQITILGKDTKALNEYADKIVTYLNSQEGVVNAQKSIKPGAAKLSFVPSQTQLGRYAASTSDLGFWTRTYASGFTLGQLRLGGEDTDINLRVTDSRLSVDELNKIIIPTQFGKLPIENFGKFELTTNPTVITREDGKRTISVSAGVQKGFSVSTLNKNLENYADSLSLPSGYTWKTGGANEENQASVNSILQAMVLSAILILATMVIQLGSYRKAIIVLLVIPLAVSGVFLLFALTGTPLSFPALIGVLALFGIVVNNSIVVVEKINQNLNIGIKLEEAIADAAASRVEPIAFSSLTTIFGLLPITLSDPLWRGLGGAIIAGLTVSGTIMLLFIPVIYYMWFKEDYK